MKTIVFKIIFISLMLYFGCFRLQDYNPEEPEWPRYDYGGVVLDSVSKEPIDSCVVTIERPPPWLPGLYFEQDDFISASDTTDSDGTFQVDSIPPGILFIYLQKENYYPNPMKDAIDVFLVDSLNYGRFTLVKIADLPAIIISPTNFSVAARVPGGARHTLIISNEGDDIALIWSLREDPPVDWLEVNPTSGVVLPHKGQNVHLYFVASEGIEPGVYRTNLIIESNDPYTPEKSILVEFEVEKG